MRHTTTIYGLERTPLGEIGRGFAEFGFSRPEGQTAERKTDAGRVAVHLSFIEHETDFDVTTDVAIRFDSNSAASFRDNGRGRKRHIVRTWISFLLILGFVAFVAIPRERPPDRAGSEMDLAYSLYSGLLPFVLTALLTSSVPNKGGGRRVFAIGAASLTVMVLAPLVGLVSRDHPFLLLGAGGSLLVLILDTIRTRSSPASAGRGHHLDGRFGCVSLAALGACLALWWGAAGSVDAEAVAIVSVTYAGFYGVAWWVNTPDERD